MMAMPPALVSPTAHTVPPGARVTLSRSLVFPAGFGAAAVAVQTGPQLAGSVIEDTAVGDGLAVVTVPAEAGQGPGKVLWLQLF